MQVRSRLRYLSRNEHKIREVTEILGEYVDVVPVLTPIEELQTTDATRLVRDKCLKAYAAVGHPVLVDHTSLYLSSLNQFPGGLTQVFWDALEADRFCALFGGLEDTAAIARTVVGYCDGKSIHQFEGEISGSISAAPKGSGRFKWDCVFIPEGETQTFAELEERKHQISMRRLALDSFLKFLREPK